MSGTPAERAAVRLARPELARLVDELYHRFGGAPPTAVRLRGLTDGERTALADLLGSARTPAGEVRLPLRRLAEVLGLEEVGQLKAVVEELRGAVVDRGAVRAAASAERAEVWAWLLARAERLPPVVDPAGWVEHLRRLGVRGSLAEHRRWLDRVLAVLAALPSDGLTLAELAQDVLGDPHALDAGRSIAAAVLDALGPTVVGHRDAETARGLWESAGVAPDALSSTVLALGLGHRAPREHPLWSLWQVSRQHSEPTLHTLAQLRRWPVPPLASSEAVVVVENPSLVAAAARSGWNAPVLVCSSGRPTVAVLTLIRQLTAAGGTAYQHADFDPVGVAITGWLAERCGTVPWRMGAVDYRAAVRGRSEAAVPSRVIPATPWDPALQAAMADSARWVYEEQVRDILLAGLRGLA